MTDLASPLDCTDGFALHKDVPSILVRDSNPSLSPLVSIMIPTYRRPDLLREAVKSALAQITTVPFEVVVVDNDSEQKMSAEVDHVIASFDAPNLRLFRNQANIGLYGNWSRCIELASGHWITILNDDDLLDQSFLAETLAVVSNNRSIRLVGCAARVRDIRNNKIPMMFLSRVKMFIKQMTGLIGNRKPRKLRIENYFLSYPHHGSLGILMERKAAVAVGGFSSEFYPISDYLFLSRFVLLNDVYYLPKVLATYRIAVNVSIKPEVCAGGIHYELRLRESLIPRINTNAWILRYYARLVAIRAALVFRKRWHFDLDVNEILKKNGLVYRPVLVEYLITRELLRVVFFLTSKSSDARVSLG